ncbi:MAG: MFS transporter [Eubacteriales bacterium]
MSRYSGPVKSLYDNFNLDKKRRKDISITIFSFAAFYIFFPITTGVPITKFADKLGAGDFFYSLLIALPIFGNALQIAASIILEKTKKRKSLFIACGIVARLSWVAIGLVPLLVLANNGSNAVYYILFFMIISSIANSMLGVGFFSWIGDLIPPQMIGRYFGLRESIGTIVSVTATLLVSIYLNNNTSYESFAIVFAIAGVAGIIDILGFVFITDIPMNVAPRPPLKAFFKKAFASAGFRRYIIFWSLWAFTLNLSVAFYNLYALTALELSFIKVAVFGQIAFNSVAFFAAPMWGNALDKSGTHHVLIRAGVVSSIIPMIMLFSTKGSIVAFLLFSIFNGMTLIGINTTAQKMLISTLPQDNRTMYIAIYSVITSIATVLGYLTGGVFLELLGDVNFHFAFIDLDRYKILFSLSGLLRLAVLIIYLPAMTKMLDEK